MRKANYMGITAAAAGRHHVALLCYEDPLTNVEAANKQLSYLHNQQANKVAATKPDPTRHSAPCSIARATARANNAPSSLFLLHCSLALLLLAPPCQSKSGKLKRLQRDYVDERLCR